MKLHLSRRDDEKVWNVINEIKSKYISRGMQISIPLLAGWAMSRYKEEIRGAELKAILDDRFWAFQFIEHKGAIYKIRYPKANNLDGKFIFSVEDDKFEKLRKSIGKTYKAKATAYQKKLIHQCQVPIF